MFVMVRVGAVGWMLLRAVLTKIVTCTRWGSLSLQIINRLIYRKKSQNSLMVEGSAAERVEGVIPGPDGCSRPPGRRLRLLRSLLCVAFTSFYYFFYDIFNDQSFKNLNFV